MQPIGFRIKIDKIIVPVADIAVPMPSQHLHRPEFVESIHVHVPAQFLKQFFVAGLQGDGGLAKNFVRLVGAKLALETNQHRQPKITNRALVQRALGTVERTPKQVLVE